MTWEVVVDWEKDNDFSGDHDDITADIWEKGVFEWNNGCQPYQHIAEEANLAFEVNNRGRKYSQENTDSPIADYLLPNRPIQVRYDGAAVYTGITRTIQPAPMRFASGTAKIECVSIKEQLQSTPAYPKLYENVTADQVIADYIPGLAVPPATTGLWLIGIPGSSEIGVSTVVGSIAGISTMDQGKTIFRYLGDNVQKDGQDNTQDNSIVNAYQFLSDLVSAERGLLFFGRDGKITFFNRHRFLNDATVDYLIDNTMADMSYSTPIDELSNYIEVTYSPRTISATNNEVLWSIGESITIPPNSSKSITAPYKDASGKPVGARNVQTTPEISYGGGVLAATVQASAQRAVITLVNSGTTPSVITTLKIKGQTISTPYPATIVAQDSASIAAVGKRPLTISLKALDSESQAFNIAYFELSRRTSTQGRVSSVKLKPALADGSSTPPGLTYTIGDLIRIKDYQTAHDGLYHICGEKHSLDVRSKMLTTEWYVNPAATTKYWVIGVPDFSNIGVSTRVAY